MKYEICYENCDGEVFDVETKEELIEDVKDCIENYSENYLNGCVRITIEKLY